MSHIFETVAFMLAVGTLMMFLVRRRRRRADKGRN
ncbi:MAG: hypothetical protein JWN34_2198 [Bryobacterales bacterium]|jgi:hypothetical protein|nr:hypothetical protein [Bryobacterales bacterium]